MDPKTQIYPYFYTQNEVLITTHPRKYKILVLILIYNYIQVSYIDTHINLVNPNTRNELY